MFVGNDMHQWMTRYLGSPCQQLDLLCAPWTDAMEPGGDQFLRERRDWANCSLPPLLDSKCRDVLLQLMNGEELISSRNALAKGHIHAPLFSVRDAASTAFSKRWFATHGLDLCCLHRQTPLPLPIFRGIRVRIGIHSGIADVVTVNGNGQRVMYGGRLSQVAKAIADAPCGGQIIMSGESLAQIESIQALKKTVAAKCAGWRHSSAKDDETMPAGLSVMHLGSHVILQQQLSENAYEMPKQDLSERGKKVERRSWKQRAMRRLKVPNSVAPSRASPVIEQDTQLKPATSSIRLLMNMDALNEAQAGLADDAPCAVDLSTLASMWQDTQKTSLPDTETGSPRDESEAIGAVSHTLAEPIPTSGGKAPLPPPATGSPPPVTSATLLNAPARPLPATTAPAAHEGGGEITAVKAASETFIHELVMVSPWPLMQRALYFPPPSTIKQVTPAWHEAPRAEGVTILFTNVENMGKLKAWENQTRSPLLDGAMRLMRQVVCDCLSTHNGYEVNETEANFVCAFHSPVDAVKFAASLQFNLIEAPWDPAALLTWWGCAIRSSNGAVIFKGLRIAVGMCTGDAFRAHPSEKSGRMEYFGPIM